MCLIIIQCCNNEVGDIHFSPLSLSTFALFLLLLLLFFFSNFSYLGWMLLIMVVVALPFRGRGRGGLAAGEIQDVVAQRCDARGWGRNRHALMVMIRPRIGGLVWVKFIINLAARLGSFLLHINTRNSWETWVQIQNLIFPILQLLLLMENTRSESLFFSDSQSSPDQTQTRTVYICHTRCNIYKTYILYPRNLCVYDMKISRNKL